MKRIVSLCLVTLTWMSCDNIQNKQEKQSNDTTVTQQEMSDEGLVLPAADILWSEVPELRDIGDFPFITAPEGIDIYDFEGDGITEIFPLKKWEVYDGVGVTSIEGKLALIKFMEDNSNGFRYDQYIFERNIPQYLDEIGAKKLYSGAFPDNESLRAKLKEPMYSGKYHVVGLSDDSPITVFAFRNNGKKYIVNLQSNSAEGNVFVIELKDFEPSMMAYKAKDMEKDLAEKGKAILYINFDTDQSTLKSDGQQVIDEIVKVLKADQNLKISIEGHTDNAGNADHNKKLSAARANAVRQGLESRGVAGSRVEAKGFGSEKPLANNNTEEGKAKNRRVELVKL